MLTLVVLLFLGVASSAPRKNLCGSNSLQNRVALTKNDMLFSLYLKAFGKEYCNDEEYKLRQTAFEESVKSIFELHKKHPDVKFGLNHRSDWTQTELKSSATGCVFIPNDNSTLEVPRVVKGNAPDAWDWREQGVITEIKNQGYCGSCYIFSAIANIEAQYAIKHGLLYSLSEQQVLDCDVVDNKCDGGFIHNAMNAIAQQGGCMLEKDYPYDAKPGMCRSDRRNIKVQLQGGKRLKFPDEETLKEYVYEHGPVSTGMYFAGKTLQRYRGNVVDPPDCILAGNDGHALLIVGYGTDGKGVPYWIIKNSWGEDWGEDGYLLLRRGVNACKLLQYTAISVV